MNIDAEIGKKVQELQVLEQNLQGFLMQKQAFQMELGEVENALQEIEKSDGEVYKIVGGIMLKSDKNTLSKEMLEKKKLLELRVNSIEKQEKLIGSKAEALRKETNALVEKKKA